MEEESMGIWESLIGIEKSKEDYMVSIELEEEGLGDDD